MKEDTAMSRLTRWTAVCLTTALVSTGLIALTGAPAAAATTIIRCIGSVDVRYSPGLTNQEQRIEFSGADHATMCASQVFPNLRNFEGPFRGTGTESCPGRFDPGAGSETLFWNGTSNLTSFWQYTYSVQRTDTSVIYTATGRVTAGIATGAVVHQQIVEPLSDFDACNQPGGMQVQEGTSSWVFVA
jgi:hypothetical protein